MQYPDFGANQRDKVSIRLNRPSHINDNNKITRRLPIHEAVGVKDAIKSGQLMVIDEVTGGFRRGNEADATAGLKVYVAYKDYDSGEVQAAGTLVGLDVTDNWIYGTGHFATGTDYTVGLEIALGDLGVHKVAEVGDVVVGKVFRVGSGTNNTEDLTGYDNTADSLLVLTVESIGQQTYIKA